MPASLDRHRWWSVVLDQSFDLDKVSLFEDRLRYGLITDEIGETGYAHKHAIFGFKNNLSRSALKKLLKCKTMHCDVIRDLANSIAYAKKQEKIVYECHPEFVVKKKHNITVERLNQRELLAKAIALSSFEEAREFIETNDVLFYCLKRSFILPFLREKFPIRNAMDTEDLSAFDEYIVSKIKKALKRNLVPFLYGGTGLGKSSILSWMFPNAFICRSELTNLEQHQPEQDVIFDDVDWSKVSPDECKNVLTQHQDSIVKVRYLNKEIKKEVHRLCASNKDIERFFPLVDDEDMAAIKRRLYPIEINKRVFQDDTSKALTFKEFQNMLILTGDA